jgi:RNA polymerase sigma-70 factor, ECF subfamily
MNHRLESSHEEGDEQSDDALVRAAQADPRRFEALYDRYVDLIYRFCRRRLQNETAAEDAASTVFTKALAALPGFDVRAATFRAWLFTIAFNVVTDQQRARLRRPETPLGEADWLLADEPALDDRLLADERRRAVSAAIAQLSDDQRQVVELRLAGLNGQEISVATGRSLGAVRSAQHRALVRLRELLSDEIDDCGSPTRRAPKGERR